MNKQASCLQQWMGLWREGSGALAGYQGKQRSGRREGWREGDGRNTV